MVTKPDDKIRMLQTLVVFYQGRGDEFHFVNMKTEMKLRRHSLNVRACAMRSVYSNAEEYRGLINLLKFLVARPCLEQRGHAVVLTQPR